MDLVTFKFAVLTYQFQRFFLMDSSGQSICKIMLYVNKDSFTSSPVCIQFISFYCLISLTRTWNIMLNRNGKTKYPCLIPDLRREASSPSPLSMILIVGFLQILIIKLNFLSIPTQLSIFIIKGCWICHMIFFFWCLSS